MDIGFIGVGRMGSRMARRLLDAGYGLTIYDTDAAMVRALVDAGARAAESPAAVGSAAEIVLVSLPTPPIVEKVAKEVAAGGRAKIFVDMSTTGATYAKKIAAMLAEHGVAQVDAPVSGGLAGAEKGTLAVMVSCGEKEFAAVEPVLKHCGKIFYVGKLPGQGQTMKLVNNLLSATAMAASAEAVVLGVKAGLDAAQVVEVINAGTGRNSATADKFPRFVLPRTFNLGFAMNLMNKDLRMCLEEAEAMDVPMIVGSAVRQLMGITEATVPDADMTDVVKVVEKWAGVTVGGK
jgi:3-hydroxyisobutyrate dehydrogenase-like beta-hydroxyacid dehydrogenase